MRSTCPRNCHKRHGLSGISKYGSYYRTSDRRKIQRYRCAHCSLYFSQATNSKCFGQKKRQLNYKIFKYLGSGLSQRRLAMLLETNHKTIARKLIFLSDRLRHKNLLDRMNRLPSLEVQFDDMETFEHTKMKPLSVTLIVEKHSRYILGFEVSKMPAKGHLAKKSVKKYGYRPDQRADARNRLFRRMKKHVLDHAIIESDKNPHYPPDVKEHFPKAVHQTHLSARGAVTGQGELKKLQHDPLFSFNHTAAMFRANMNRYFRKTWCTTKNMQSLANHMELYVYLHNQYLLK